MSNLRTSGKPYVHSLIVIYYGPVNIIKSNICIIFSWRFCENLRPAVHHAWLCFLSPDVHPDSGEEQDPGQKQEISGGTVAGDETKPPGVSDELIDSGRKSIYVSIILFSVVIGVMI